MEVILSDIGTSLLQIALFIAVAQGCLGCAQRPSLQTQWLPALAIGGFVSLSAALATLIYAFAQSDFSVLAVYQHSHSLKPLLYKITGSWGNHEGSILLWCWVMSLYNMLLAMSRQVIPRAIRHAALMLFAWMIAAFIGFTVFTSNPFGLIIPTPAEGLGLNPLLQDVGLALHPPLLYLGYIGFAACFVLAVAMLQHVRTDATLKDQASLLHPWIMYPWAALTLGIGLGSWWAYRELGWGGWWFWDPVENASFLPWLSATALFHSNAVMRRTGNFARWVLLLCLLTFILSMIGTFLVRSGILTSVHSFANDPARGLSILVMIAALSAYALVCYWRYSKHIPQVQSLAFQSVGTMILVNNMLLLLTVAMILLAMLYPLLLEALGMGIISIGAEYYQASFRIIAIPLLLACSTAFFLPYGGKVRTDNKKPLLMTITLSLAFTAIIGIISDDTTLLYLCGIFISIWLLTSIISSAISMKRRNSSFGSVFAMMLGHSALACFTLAATINAKYTTEYEIITAPLIKNTVDDFHATLTEIRYDNGKNYITRYATVAIEQDGNIITLFPEERYYPVSEQFTSEAYIQSFLTYDLYATVTKAALQEVDMQKNNDASSKDVQFQLRIMRNPLMMLLWISVLFLGISGLLAARHTRGSHD
jgi:cytochrome c-type biogenesis protein CcmF